MPPKQYPPRHDELASKQNPPRREGASVESPAPQAVSAALAGRVKFAPRLLTPHDILQLQHTFGNAAVVRFLDRATPRRPPQDENRTGLPGDLRAGVESLSGVPLDDVRVHYNSPRPAELEAHAYTQGADIHVAPGQEKHLPHEAWHAAQQRRGAVRATGRLKGAAVNEDARLEREADTMGERAARVGRTLAPSSGIGPRAEWLKAAAPALHYAAPARHAGAGAPVQRIAADAPEWVAYRQSKIDLAAKRAVMEANKAAANQGVRNAIDPDITQALVDYANNAMNRSNLAKTDLPNYKTSLDNLSYYADHYSSKAKIARLAQLDTYNTVTHKNSVQVLWGNWKNNLLGAAGKAKFDELFKSVPTIYWDRKGGVAGVPDATKNPTVSKYKLGGMQQAVLDGLVNNQGNLRVKPVKVGNPGLGRGGHNTNPTTGAGGGGAQEYNAVSATPLATANWDQVAIQPNPAGPERFVQYSGKWFYSPKHYVGAAGVVVQGYQLIIDA